jgi:phospholipid transport system substrate-binding protein
MDMFVRRFARAAAAAIAALHLASPPPARAEARDGTEFVRAFGDAALALLRARTDLRERADGLRALYRIHFDNDAIAAQVLGRAWRQASAAQRGELAALLEIYFTGLMAAQLADFADGEFRVLLSAPDGQQVVVLSQLADRRRRSHLNIGWRLAKSGADFRVRDLVVENVSVALHHRREFAAALRDSVADAEATIRLLRARIARLHGI